MRFTTAAVFSALAAFAAAYTQPDYSKAPQGNAIVSPGLNEQVPEGAPYTIKWEPTLGKKVSLVLLRGPSSNVKPLETIVEDIPNSGSYKWTPSTSLTVDTTHYGILLVVEGTGAYQWSTQFGIAAPAGGSAETTTSASGTVSVIDDVTTTYCPEEASSSSASKAAATTPATVVVTDDVTTTYCPEEASSSSASMAAATTPASTPATVSAAPSPSSSTVWATLEMTTTYCPEEASSSAAAASSTSGVPVSPVSTPVRPTTLRSSPVSSSVAASSTASATPSSTPVFNGAGRNAISLGAVAAGVFAVLAL